MWLYAIASSLERAAFFLKSEVPYLQLRLKGRSLSPHQSKIRQWIEQFPKTKIIINDDPQIAQQIGAWGVHLGQEDLASLEKISFLESCQNTLHLGISTHSFDEIQQALSWNPAYLGFGPVFSTTTKPLDWKPQGLSMLKQVVTTTPCPVVAIGGISLENWKELQMAKPHALALISGLDCFKKSGELQSFMEELNGAELDADATEVHIDPYKP